MPQIKRATQARWSEWARFEVCASICQASMGVKEFQPDVLFAKGLSIMGL